MRNIVLSFDDGLYDFKINALPILDKYNFKACVNVVTKFSELGEFDGYKYLTINDLNDIKRKGFELACHSDTHQKISSINDLLISKRKMIQYFGNENYGLILPFSQTIDSKKANIILDNFSYLADYKTNRLKNTFYYNLSRIFARVFKAKKNVFYYCNFSYFFDNRTDSKVFSRLPIKTNISPKVYINFLKHMPNNASLVLMFHSITDNYETCPWPDGSWTTKKFDHFLRYLNKHRNRYNVVTQRSILHE